MALGWAMRLPVLILKATPRSRAASMPPQEGSEQEAGEGADRGGEKSVSARAHPSGGGGRSGAAGGRAAQAVLCAWLKPAHEVDHLAHVSMVASTGAVMLLPAYARNFLPWSVTSRPLRGNAPTIDLVVGANKASKSPILKLFLSRLDEITATQSRAP